MKQFKAEEGILIFSEARGGSTWLMEVLSNIPKTVINWEPLHVNKGVIPAKYNWGWRPFISEENKNSDFLKTIQQLLAFKIHTSWTLRFCGIKKLIRSKIVITKFVRANLLLPFILKNVELKHKPILLLRHPIDTCLSQMKTFKQDYNTIKPSELPTTINNARYIEHQNYLKQLQTPLEYKVANWCLNNVSTLNHKEAINKSIIVFYEDLVLDPSTEFKRILIELELGTDSDSILTSVSFTKASRTNYQGELKNDPKEQLYKNFKQLDSKVKEDIQKVFNYFNFTLYDAYSPYPKN